SNQNGIPPPVADSRQDLQPDLRAPRRPRPQPQHLFDPFQVHPYPYENRPVFYAALVAHFHHQSIQVDDRIYRLQRAALPRLHFLHHSVGDFADQCRAYFHAIHFLQVTLDIARRHATCEHRQNLPVEAGESSLMFGDDFWIVTAVAIAGYLDFHRTEIALDLFPALAVAVVSTSASTCGMLFIAEMVAHLRIHGA